MDQIIADLIQARSEKIRQRNLIKSELRTFSSIPEVNFQYEIILSKQLTQCEIAIAQLHWEIFARENLLTLIK